jgi:hypothetical protein
VGKIPKICFSTFSSILSTNLKSAWSNKIWFLRYQIGWLCLSATVPSPKKGNRRKQGKRRATCQRDGSATSASHQSTRVQGYRVVSVIWRPLNTEIYSYS